MVELELHTGCMQRQLENMAALMGAYLSGDDVRMVQAMDEVWQRELEAERREAYRTRAEAHRARELRDVNRWLSRAHATKPSLAQYGLGDEEWERWLADLGAWRRSVLRRRRRARSKG